MPGSLALFVFPFVQELHASSRLCILLCCGNYSQQTAGFFSCVGLLLSAYYLLTQSAIIKHIRFFDG